ncbi:hypothetical protein Tco_0706556 [Tanacetum coccineum]|uniref:Retroviral polymerase SH3-like domain-containing protein n=1 Tax=Tanacetum coccineum TaxID=301880 RepID=A0ABQ4Y8L2_9ASTR
MQCKDSSAKWCCRKKIIWTLIEAARTKLADSLQPYSNFGSSGQYCLSLGKLHGNQKKGYLLGYSTNSKGFRVYNMVTRKVQDCLHVNFLENQENQKGKGPDWMFDLDLLTPSMNYIPVRKENYADSGDKVSTLDDVEDLDDQQFIVHTAQPMHPEERTAAKEVPLSSEEQALHDELMNLMHQESLAKAHNDDQRIAFEEEKRRISIAKGKEHVDSTFILSTANTPPQSTGNTPTGTDDEFQKDGMDVNSASYMATSTEEVLCKHPRCLKILPSQTSYRVVKALWPVIKPQRAWYMLKISSFDLPNLLRLRIFEDLMQMEFKMIFHVNSLSFGAFKSSNLKWNFKSPSKEAFSIVTMPGDNHDEKMQLQVGCHNHWKKTGLLAMQETNNCGYIIYRGRINSSCKLLCSESCFSLKDQAIQISTYFLEIVIEQRLIMW